MRNFLSLAAYQSVMRTGWIFKTESIIMPAVADAVAGAGWVRGCLPLLNRFGHSLPPMLLAQRVQESGYKKWVLFTTTSMMAVLFLTLSLLFHWHGGRPTWWMPLAFLGIYASFFMCIGVNQLAFNTLQGKLIRATSRGRLLLTANSVGAASAVTCAFLLLPRWLPESGARFDLIFGFSGALFAASALTVLFLVESKDRVPRRVVGLLHPLRDTWRTWRGDANFRLLTCVAALFGTSIMLFPHYQNLGLSGMQMELKSLMWWVIVQNVGTGLFSIPVGRIADRYGNRAVLLIAMLGAAVAPILAIALQYAPSAWGQFFYHLVFVFVGLTPVVLRTLQNFALELCQPEQHPRYLSTLALCMSAPMFLSPLVGWLIDAAGFQVVFLSIAGMIIFGWMLAFLLQEPRQHVKVGVVSAVD